MSKYFPINTKTACNLKWSWSTIFLTTGETASCHRASHGVLTSENFSNFHNLPQKVLARKQMLAGEWPSGGCEYCKNIEANGGTSDRMFQNGIALSYPPELRKDPTLTEVNPTTLEVFFDNTCNLSCVYCTERYSSTIQRENKRFGGALLPQQRYSLDQNKYVELSPLLWNWLDSNFDKLQRLHIMGGEPFIQQDFDRLIQFIDTHPNPKLELAVVTNLMVKHANLKKCIESLQKLKLEKKIRRVDIMCSVDCWGEEQEYIRYGFKCETFDQNFTYLLEFDFIRLGILSTVNTLSIPSMPMLAKKLSEWNLTKEINWHMHLVLPIDTHVLSPKFFDYHIWEPYFLQTLSYINNNSFDSTATKNVMCGIMDTLRDGADNQALQSELIAYLNGIDSRRNLNWRNIFPWLNTELKNVV
jgi:organic radical activating enzyme